VVVQRDGQPLPYSLKVKLSQHQETVTEMVQKFGVRKLELVQNPDAYGHSFYFKLNGVPVFMKGADYVPPDAVDLQVSSSRYESLVHDAVDANMNMLRIWGGGIYESDTLYDLCDKNGLLVWQDFMFANAMQPDDSVYLENVRQEAVQNVKRLRSHPCLALWCGNNEELIGWKKWGWKNQFPKDVSEKLWKGYQELFYKTLPEVVKDYSPGTPYRASTPSAWDNELPDKKSGDEHEWRIWSDVAPFSAYGDRPGRFVDAFGMQSFPAMRTLHTFAVDSDLEAFSPLMDFRQRSKMPWINPSMNGNQMILNYIQMYYNDPADFESFVYVSQVMQAEALKAGIEAQRINRPRCMGSLYWQLNDCWPAISWSTIDYDGRWKPSHYTVKRSFANVLVVPKLLGGNIKIFAVNDSMKPLEGELHLNLLDFTGKRIWSQVDSFSVNPDTVQVLWKGRQGKVCPGNMNIRCCLLVQMVSKNKVIAENTLYFTDPKYLDLPVPDISYKAEGSDGQFELVLATDKLAKNVVLDTYEKDSHFSENNFDLMPGRDMHLTVTYSGTRDELLNDLKIYSLVNSF
jgi:beta-mannosidase